MARISKITAREILDSRGNPTIEARVELDDSTVAVAACPSGASVGTYEARELRDNDPKHFMGKGVVKAVENVNTIIAPKLQGADPINQASIDKTMIELDGTQNKSKLGANALLSVSMSVAKAAAVSAKMPLYTYLRQFTKKTDQTYRIPTPLFNVINGGKHVGAGSNIDFQEFLIIPATSKPYKEALFIGTNVYHTLQTVLANNNFTSLVGDEGGYGVPVITNSDPFFFMKQAAEMAGYRVGYDMFFGMDAAATSFFHQHHYLLKNKGELSRDDLLAYYQELNAQHHLLYLEDGLAEDDWDGWQRLSSAIGQTTLIVGDDLTVTNPLRLQMALEKKVITGIIIKPNQIGTVIEAIAVVEMAQAMNVKTIVSHRSGETNDDFIADFAVAVSADYAKFGAPARGERVAKYNRLSAIDHEITSANT